MSTTTIIPGIVGTILWARSNAAHNNHLHVEPPSRISGEPPSSNPGMTAGLVKIVDELVRVFGPTAYMTPPEGGWSNMGYYNRRYIAGTTTWSQHAYANAIDIGPYYGVAEQQKFYDFLIGKEIETVALTKQEEDFIKDMYAFAVGGDRWVNNPETGLVERVAGHAKPSDGSFAGAAVDMARAGIIGRVERLESKAPVPGPKGDKGDRGSKGDPGAPAPTPTRLIPEYD